MTARRAAGWRVEQTSAAPSTLLDRWPAPGNEGVAAVRVARVTGRGALVLGSTQDSGVVDDERAATAGIDVLRRTTGGGAVLVAPGAQVWFDVWLPRRHALWDDDIITAARWWGARWRHALEALGVPGLAVHDGPATGGGWSRLVCFAGLGPGEVHRGGTKVTGVAQRRTAAGARFHTIAPARWDPAPLLDLLRPPPSQTTDGPSDFRGVAVGLHDLLPTSIVPASSSGSDDDTGAVIAAVENAVLDTLA